MFALGFAMNTPQPKSIPMGLQFHLNDDRFCVFAHVEFGNSQLAAAPESGRRGQPCSKRSNTRCISLRIAAKISPGREGLVSEVLLISVAMG
jgi:hypothetical protein